MVLPVPAPFFVCRFCRFNPVSFLTCGQQGKKLPDPLNNKPPGRKTEKGISMAENMNENTHSENMGDEMQGGADSPKKTFTQEEVNNFIQSRFSRMKAQAAKENEAAFSEREKALHDREMKLLVKEQLSARGMSMDLADVITCTDEKDLNTKLDTLQKVYSSSDTVKKSEASGFVQIGAGNNSASGFTTSHDPVRAAMGLKGN